MSNLLQIKEILAKYNKTPTKSLGQNFLVNPSAARRIAEAGAPADAAARKAAGVLEIGPGLGMLTRELCGIFKKTAAVELDRSLGPALAEALADLPEESRPSLAFDDFLSLNLPDCLRREFAGCEEIYACANLPYYITTQAIVKLAGCPVRLSGITATIQSEAANRFCSKPGSAQWCEAAALISLYGAAERLFSLPPHEFYPQPGVGSAVIRITPHAAPPAVPKDEKILRRVIAAAFASRRKTLANSLSAAFGISKGAASEIAAGAAGSPIVRGEELDIKALSEISDFITEIT